MDFHAATNESHDPPEVRVALKRLDLEAMLESLGVETLGRRGEWLEGKCPFHDGGGGWGILTDGDAKVMELSHGGLLSPDRPHRMRAARPDILARIAADSEGAVLDGGDASAVADEFDEHISRSRRERNGGDSARASDLE